MSRPCTICASSMAGDINARLPAGHTLRSVALDFGVSEDALTRHARNHVTVPLPAPDHLAPGDADPLDELTAALRTRALNGSDAASREYRLALAAQAAAQHATAPHRALTDEPEWHALRTIMLKALTPFPEARVAIADALAEAGA